MSGDWSWGPEARAKPAAGSLVMVVLAAVIVALVAAGGVGVAIHHRSTTVAVTPVGYQRVVDTADQISLAVPSRWRVVSITTGQLNSDLDSLKAAEPQLAGPLDLAEAGLTRVSPGVFAIDVATRTTVFSYGVATPGIHSVGDIPTDSVVAPFASLGAKNIKATRIHLPVGDAEQVSAELTIGSVTVSELLDYFVLHGRRRCRRHGVAGHDRRPPPSSTRSRRPWPRARPGLRAPRPASRTRRASRQNSLPSGSASTTHGTSPWPTSTRRAPSDRSRCELLGLGTARGIDVDVQPVLGRLGFGYGHENQQRGRGGVVTRWTTASRTPSPTRPGASPRTRGPETTDPQWVLAVDDDLPQHARHAPTSAHLTPARRSQ